VHFSQAAHLLKRQLSDANAPLWAQIFITRRCNLNCSFCAVPRCPSNEMRPDEWLRALEILSSLGVRVMNVVGGEPTLYDGLWNVLHYASRCNIATILHSNMINVNNSFVSSLSRAGVFALEASIDSLDNTHPKSNRHVLDVLNDARALGIIPIVSTVITKSNIDQIGEIAQRVTEANIMYLVSVYQTVGGCFSTRDMSMVPDCQDLERLFLSMQQLKKTTSLIKNSSSFLSAPSIHNGNKWHCNGARTLWITIDSNGLLMPCQEYRSDMTIFELESQNNLDTWVRNKYDITRACDGCSYHCYYEAEALNGIAFAREVPSYLRGLIKLNKHSFQ